MTEELIDIVDKLGNPIGQTAPKSEIHTKGLYHNTVHLWLYTESGQILLQQRSHKKDICPLLWDVSVAGHIDAGESFETAAIRETQEEIGFKLQVSELKKIGVFLHESQYYNGRIKDNEFHHVYITPFDGQLKDLTPQQDEVEALKLVTIPEFNKLLKNSKDNSHFVTSNMPYYQFVSHSILKAISL